MKLDRVKRRLQAYGVLGTLKIAIAKSFSKHRRKEILALQNREDRFTKIYTSNHWNDQESRSGEGSTLENTKALRAALPGVFERYDVRTLLDAPCGDFNWMRQVVAESDVQYVGGDIVRPLVEENQQKFASDRIRFQQLDLTSDPLPEADLLFCRDCLFHLSFDDIEAVLQNFISSGIPRILTTTNVSRTGDDPENADIQTGDMRPLVLTRPPFDLDPDDIVEAIADNMASREDQREMLLLERSTVQKLLENLRNRPAR